MTSKITVDQNTLLYVMEQLYVKAYSDGKKGLQTGFSPDTIQSIAKEFVYDTERYSYAKSRFK